MNFKKYHESRNLFDKYAEYTVGQTAYQYTISGLTPNQKYTCSTNFVAKTDKEAAIYFNGGSTGTNGVDYRTPKTFTCGSSGTMTVLVRFQATSQSNPAIYDDLMNGTIWIMVNEGSTPQPYEPYSSEVWHDIPYYQHKTATDTLTLPAVIYPNDTSITVGIKGQSSQASTPTPSHPLDVNGCGERTENLFDVFAYSSYTTGISNIVTTSNSITYTAASAFLAIRYFFPLNATDIFTVQLGSESSKVRLELRYRKNESTVGDPIVVTIGNSYVIRGSEDVDEIQISISNGTSTGTCKASNIMLNAGSEALPYEPYGYKIPILSGGTTTPVYLGEVETTRRIKKLVLDGTENWVSKGNPATFRYENSPILHTLNSVCYCSHFKNLPWVQVPTTNNSFIVWFTSVENTINIRCEDYSTVEDFKAFLAQQYTNGTPVTIWYVLATEETAITNEPLMKIGTYADSLTTSIPCTAGENTLDVDTTVQPSEVSAGFSGWHPVADVHERENGQWD
jgi:hypothetical protein